MSVKSLKKTICVMIRMYVETVHTVDTDGVPFSLYSTSSL